MIKLTLDTNCVINLLDYKSKSAISVDELAEITRYALEGDVNIVVTTRVENDVNKDKDQNRKSEILKRISMFPVIGTIARVGTSKCDSGDVVVSEDHQALEDEIKKIIFPNLKKDDPHYSNKINDVDHLIGHIINKRDIFVTDDQQILKKTETLKLSVDIRIMSPKETLEYINLQANPVVLAQEFYEKFEEYKDIVIIAMSNSINDTQLVKYEELRKWMTRKLPAIKDGLLRCKLQMVSIPVGGKRTFKQGDLMTLEMFNDRLNDILEERDPLMISKIVSKPGYNYVGYEPEETKIKKTTSFLNSVEDSLLEYLGTLETQ